MEKKTPVTIHIPTQLWEAFKIIAEELNANPVYFLERSVEKFIERELSDSDVN